jgi:hypothetical protein
VVFSVTGHAVSLETQEFSIRMALGVDTRDMREIVELVKRLGILYKLKIRRMLESVLSICTLDRGTLSPTCKRPFTPVRECDRNRRLAERVGF